MSLSARLSRIEASEDNQLQRFEIVAADEVGAMEQFEEIMLHSRPGPYSISYTVAGRQFEKSGIFLPFEDMLELLS